jgi:ABC-2 type transport system permease protein
MVNAKRILADLRLFGRGYIRNGVGLFFGLIFPVILIILFGAIFSGGASATKLYVQNQDTGPVSPQFVQALNGTINGVRFNGTWPINVQLVDPSENFTQYLADNSASDGVIIPENFSLNYIADNPNITTSLTVYGNPTSSSSAIVSGTVREIANAFNLRNQPQTIQIQSATVALPALANGQKEEPKYIDYLIPGLIGFSILISPMFAMVNISAEYKKMKLFKQLSLTPLSKMEWLASKVLWYILLSAISFLILAAVGIIGFQAHISLTLWLVPFIVLGPMLFCSLGMLVGTLSKSVETASIIGNVITFPMMFLSGTFFPIQQMPQYLQSFAHVLPLFYIVEGLNNVMVHGNYNAALIDIAVVTVITVIVFVAAAKLFKWRED